MSLTEKTRVNKNCAIYQKYGQCCCQCKNIFEIRSHPSFGGSIMDVVMYGCMFDPGDLAENERFIILQAGRHSIGCELFREDSHA